jgi:hypothetical protein
MLSRASRSRRSLRSSAFVLAMALGGVTAFAGSGCGDRQLRKISAPRGGVRLAYALEPATAYAGKLDVGVTRQVDGADEPIRQAISGDVTMVVIGEAPDGGTRVRITLTRGDLDWGLLPTSTYSRNAFLEIAVKRLKGLHLPMTIGPAGGVVERPPIPDDIPEEIAEVLDTVVDALAQSFVVVPDRKLSRGDRWTPAGPGRMQSRFKGLFRHVERGENVANLSLEMTKVPIGRNQDGERQGSTQALFAVEGYPARIDVECRDFDPEQGMKFRRVQVEWKKAGRAPPELRVTNDEPEDVQVIADPCNPDYVGPAACQELEVLEDPDADDDETEGDTDGDTD